MLLIRSNGTDPKKKKNDDDPGTDREENTRESIDQDSKSNLQTGRGYEDEFEEETEDISDDDDADTSEPIN